MFAAGPHKGGIGRGKSAKIGKNSVNRPRSSSFPTALTGFMEAKMYTGLHTGIGMEAAPDVRPGDRLGTMLIGCQTTTMGLPGGNPGAVQSDSVGGRDEAHGSLRDSGRKHRL